MNKFIKKTGACLLGVASLVGGMGSALAWEPNNDHYPWEQSGTAPWSSGDELEYLNSWTTGSINGGNFTIESSSDVDYYVLSCGGIRKVSQVKITFTDADGDLDIKAYRLDGTLLGSSSSVTDDETVDVSSKNEDTVILKVYGYGGATNTYRRILTC